jgi:serine/threonine protein kinase
VELINQKIGKYILTRVIGEGGMACVYEGLHEKLGTRVAIKVLNPILARNAQLRQRFENEANFMASLNHPNITRVLDLEEQDGTIAIVMELLEGEDLDERVKRLGPLSAEEIKPLFDQVLNAFEYAHSKGIVHRDIKPANIFVDASNQVKILDFGIAKIFGTGNEMTQTGTQMGTPVYMSPEQVKGDKSIDHRSDIYSLGVTLYFLLSAKVPYESSEDSSYEIFTKIVNEPIPLLDNNDFYNSIINKAVAKDRNERFQSIDDLKTSLKNAKTIDLDFTSKIKSTDVKPEIKSESSINLDGKSRLARIAFVLSLICIFLFIIPSFIFKYISILLSIFILNLALKVNQYSKKHPIKNKWMSYWASISSILVIMTFLLLFFHLISF